MQSLLATMDWSNLACIVYLFSSKFTWVPNHCPNAGHSVKDHASSEENMNMPSLCTIYFSILWLTGVNIVVSVLCWVSLGNIHKTIRNSCNGLQNKDSRGYYSKGLNLVEFKGHIWHARHTWNSFSNPQSLFSCMALTCSEKWRFITTCDDCDEESVMAAGEYNTQKLQVEFYDKGLSG